METLDRRGFLRLCFGVFAGALIGYPPPKPETKENPADQEITIAVLNAQTQKIRGQGVATGDIFCRQIEKALVTANQPVNLVLTPEHSFETYTGRGQDYEPERLKLDIIDGCFEVNKRTNQHTAEIILRLQGIARYHHCPIFAATFYEYENGVEEYFSTMLHISSEGKIVGRKRKLFPPEGLFTIKRGAREFKILPLICGEIWRENDENGFSVIPEWVREGAPYDIMLHSLHQGDLNLGKLMASVQDKNSELTTEEGRWTRDCFDQYYRNYLLCLKPGGALVAADWNGSGIFNQDLSPIKKIYSIGTTTIATIPIP